MENVAQRLLSDTRFRDVNAWVSASATFSADAKDFCQHQYVTLLLGILERKIRRSMPKLLAHPALLAHTIYQSLVFDSTLRELGYEFGRAESKSDEDMESGGISRIILDQKEWFDAWLEGEKKCTFHSYMKRAPSQP